ncbi:hypothetical protein CVE35_29965 [Pseudomonas syringae pv. actinidiae]|nr:hypothetical protein [Pseudomonas syringae pv. actinidiae]
MPYLCSSALLPPLNVRRGADLSRRASRQAFHWSVGNDNLTTAIVRRSASHAVLDALRPLFSVRSARFSGFTDHPRPAQFLPLKPCRHWLCKSWTAFCNRSIQVAIGVNVLI